MLVLPLQAAVLWGQACTRTSCILVAPDTWLTTLYVLIAVAIALPLTAGLVYVYYVRRGGSWRQQRLLERDSSTDLPTLLLRAEATSPADPAARSDAPADETQHSSGTASFLAAREEPATAASPSSSTAVGALPAAERREASPTPISPQLAGFVLLLLTITPSASVQVSSFQYDLFSGTQLLCEQQYLSLLNYSVSVVSSLLFGRVFKGQPLRRIVVVSGLLASLASLSGIALPSLCAHAPISPVAAPPPTPPLAPLPPNLPPPPPPCDMDTAFTIAALSTGIGGLFSELGFLPKVIIATEVAARLADDANAGSLGGAQSYAIMLTIIDLGDAISLQVTAPIVSALGITTWPANFVALPTLIAIGAVCSAVVLTLIVPWAIPHGARVAE
jgi:hypothetical protein